MQVMEFRWLALIALWTILSGPMIGPPTQAGRSRHSQTVNARSAEKENLPRASHR